MDKLSLLLEKQKPAINILNFPSVVQSASDKSGIAAVQSVLAYYGEDMKEETLIDKLIDSNTEYIEQSYIVSLGNMISFFMAKRFQIVAKNMNINDLINYINQGIPVIMMIQAWGKNPDYSDEWNSNHYVVAIGYNKTNIIFMDPHSYVLGTLGHRQLMERWHGRNDLEKYVNFGIAVKGTPNYDKNEYIEIG